MKDITSYVKRNWYTLSVLLIVAFAAFLRFYNYLNRYAIAGDQAAFAIVGRYAVEHLQLPLLGPFSSAGPFQTGGEWYWIIMLGTILNPSNVLSPWIFITLLFVAFVLLSIYVGTKLIDRKFGLIVGVLSAVSSSQIAQSADLTNQSPIGFFSLLSVLFMILYSQKKKLRFLFLMGLCIGIASSIHLQGVTLFCFALITAIFYFPGIRGVMALLAGIVIAWVPVLIADLGHNFFNFRNMFYYFFLEKNKIPYEALGRRWLTFLGVAMPKYWAHIIGGYVALSVVAIAGSLVLFVYGLLKKQISRQLIVLTVSTFSMIFVVRYIRTPIFDSYWLFLHPFVIILTSFVIYTFMKKNIWLGLAVLLTFTGGSFIKEDLYLISSPINVNVLQPKYWDNALTQKFPDNKFTIYDYKYETVTVTMPLGLFLFAENKNDERGRKIGFFIADKRKNNVYQGYPLLFQRSDGYRVYDLNSSTSAELEKVGWVDLNPASIYRSTEEWYKK